MKRTVAPASDWSRGFPALLLMLCFAIALGLQAAATRADAPAQLADEAHLYLPLLVRPLTSTQLIDHALARQEINAETALLYKVFAAYGDARLPARYQGDDTQVIENNMMRDAAAAWASLSPQTQALLRPFFIPPAYTGSWADDSPAGADGVHLSLQEPQDLRLSATVPLTAPIPDPLPKTDWTNLTSNSHVKIWWQIDSYDEQDARALLAEADKVWGDLVILMGREPLSDVGQAGDGGDERLDIYLYPIGGRELGRVIPFQGCDQTPGWMWLDASAATNLNELKATFAHEFMHAIQYSYDYFAACAEYAWLDEASADWAIDYVYPTQVGNYEHKSASGFLNEPQLSLEAGPESHYYGAYLFPFYVAGQGRANAAWVRKLYFNVQIDESLAAVQHTLEETGLGGFQEQWPLFILRNWNRGPITDYQQWDMLPYGAKASSTVEARLGPDGNFVTLVELAGAPDHLYKLDAKVDHLAAKYYHFIFKDANARAVGFNNPFYSASLGTDDEAASVWALVKIAGRDWEQPQDWTELDGKTFCRDLPEERIEELVLIFSNSEWEDRAYQLHPYTNELLHVTNIGCRQWRGNFTATRHRTGTGQDNITEVSTVTNIVFKPRPDALPEFTIWEVFDATEGSVNWRVSGTHPTAGGTCQVSGERSDVPIISDPPSYAQLIVGTYDAKPGIVHYRHVDGGGSTYSEFIETHTCTESDGAGGTRVRQYEVDIGHTSWFFVPSDTVKADGVIEGTYVVESGSDTYTYEYRLVAEATP